MDMNGADESRVVTFRWVGSEEAYLDQPSLAECGSSIIGRYGGRTEAGAHKNEDGALVWCDAGRAWEFAALLDAHFSAESAELILATLETERPAYRKAADDEDYDTALVWVGEGVDLITSIEPAAALVARISADAEARLRESARLLR